MGVNENEAEVMGGGVRQLCLARKNSRRTSMDDENAVRAGPIKITHDIDLQC